MTVKVLFHDNCFDGAASAAVFSRFYRERINPQAQLTYQGLAHQAGGASIDESLFSGDENAIVDFRYSQSEKLTWWFDHHRSAFQQTGDEAHFLSHRGGKKFYDPHRKSCTKFLADTVSERFGFNPEPMRELIEWAETIDGAQFASAKEAVELKQPALQIMTVLEANRDALLIPQVIREMQHSPLLEIASDPGISKSFAGLLQVHQRSIELVRQKARLDRGVVFFDLADEVMESLNKFISYYLYPDAQYTVWVGRSGQRVKISVGSNPWKPEGRRHDLSQIAGRFGGGGHAVVAAISFKPDELARARQVASQIALELKS